MTMGRDGVIRSPQSHRVQFPFRDERAKAKRRRTVVLLFFPEGTKQASSQRAWETLSVPFSFSYITNSRGNAGENSGATKLAGTTRRQWIQRNAKNGKTGGCVERCGGNARGIGDSTCWGASRRYRLESNAPGLRFSEGIERTVLLDLHTCKGFHSTNGK